MSTPSPVILIDDGELDEVRQLLAQLGVGYREETSVESAAGSSSCSLLITSVRRALASGNGGAAGAHPQSKFHIVVYDTLSRTVRRVLSQSGCDVVIGRPIHPAVLRLLVSHALYSGPERRNLGRVAMAAPVKLRVDRRPRDATLVQLSLRGCGLAASQNVEVGRDVEVIFPPELTGGEALALAGEVLAAGSSASVPPKRPRRPRRRRRFSRTTGTSRPHPARISARARASSFRGACSPPRAAGRRS
jgi:hypothetical protein